MNINFLDLLLKITHWHWFAIATVMIILEVTCGANFFSLWLGMIAVVVGAILWSNPDLTWQLQLLIFAIGSVACIFFWKYYLNTHPAKTDRPKLNRRSEQYIGRTFTLIAAIENGRGKITVDDSTWTVSGSDLVVGTKVRVTGSNGVILKVEVCN